MSGRVAGWGQGGGPPSFLPSLVICSKPGMDGARSPLTCSTLGVSVPKCCLAMEQVRAQSLLSQFPSQLCT